MIDTLARHIAALSEARRLVGMVLAKNGVYCALQLCNPERDAETIGRLALELASDPAYRACVALDEALLQARPGPDVDAAAGAPAWQSRIALLPAPAEPMAEAAASAVEPCRIDRPAPAAAVTAVAPPARAKAFAPAHDEARVAIVFRDTAPGDGTTPTVPAQVKGKVARREGPAGPFFRLFR